MVTTEDILGLKNSKARSKPYSFNSSKRCSFRSYICPSVPVTTNKKRVYPSVTFFVCHSPATSSVQPPRRAAQIAVAAVDYQLIRVERANKTPSVPDQTHEGAGIGRSAVGPVRCRFAKCPVKPTSKTLSIEILAGYQATYFLLSGGKVLLHDKPD